MKKLQISIYMMVQNYVKVFKKKLKPVNDSEFVKYISSEHIQIVLVVN